MGQNLTVGEATGAVIYYHTEAFSGKKIAFVGVAGLVALTTLVLGILGYLHLLAIPPQATDALLFIGNDILVGGFIFSMIWVNDHLKRVKKLKEYLKGQEGEQLEWWRDGFQCLESPGQPKASFDFKNSRETVFGILHVSGKTRTIRLFLHEKSSDDFMAYLSSVKGYVAQENALDSAEGSTTSEESSGEADSDEPSASGGSESSSEEFL